MPRAIINKSLLTFNFECFLHKPVYSRESKSHYRPFPIRGNLMSARMENYRVFEVNIFPFKFIQRFAISLFLSFYSYVTFIRLVGYVVNGLEITFPKSFPILLMGNDCSRYDQPAHKKSKANFVLFCFYRDMSCHRLSRVDE